MTEHVRRLITMVKSDQWTGGWSIGDKFTATIFNTGMAEFFDNEGDLRHAYPEEYKFQGPEIKVHNSEINSCTE